MKLRLKNNLIRLRLTKSEIAVLKNSGRVEEAIEFGAALHQRFFYSLESSAETETVRAIFEGNRMTIFLPQTQADEWTGTTQIGIESLQEIGGGKTLRLLIEKDFYCLEQHSEEDGADAFPLPTQEKI